MFKINLPEKVNEILNVLMAAGYEAFAVGGCVRDSLLCREPNDWDVTTSARPEEVKALFRRTVDTGIKHGTVTVLLGDDSYEVTTYRIDGTYEDGRHPTEVKFTSLLSEDLKRRDFTINAMAYNDKQGLVDLFNGQEDLKRRVIRAVGNPKERFEEDALRIMRAVRFAAQLDYNIDEATARACKELAQSLEKISAERIHDELTKLMCSHHPEKLKIAYDLGITKVILPEFDRMMITGQNNPHHCYTVGEHTIHAYCNIDTDKYDKYTLMILRYGMLFHDMGKPACRRVDDKGIDHFSGHPEVSAEIADYIMKRLKFDNKSRATIVSITRYHDLRPRLTVQGIRKMINNIGLETANILVDVQTADIMAQSDYEREEKQERLSRLQEFLDCIYENKDPLFVKDLALNGNDLMNENIATGREIGMTLNHLLSLVLDDPKLNEREILLRLAKDYCRVRGGI